MKRRLTANLIAEATFMCGRFGLALSNEQLTELLDLPQEIDVRARYNIAPSQRIMALRNAGTEREVTTLKWGLVPFWAKDPKVGYRLINARSETAHEKPSFREAFKRHRCLVPADGFYEWRNEGKRKQPYHIGLKDNGGFLMAGLWDRWMDQDTGEVLETCTLLTTQANPLIRPIHERMPVIVPKAQTDAWLDPSVPVPPHFFAPYPAEWMTHWPVSPVVNHAGHDEPNCRMRQALLL